MLRNLGVIAAALLIGMSVASCKRSASSGSPDPMRAGADGGSEGGARAAQASEGPAQPSLLDQLSAEVGGGKPIAIVAGPEGIVALSLNGAQRRTLVSRPAKWVFVDDRAHVIWFQQASGGKSELWVLDLERASAIPELVVTGLPENEVLVVGYAGKAGNRADVIKPASAEYDGCVQLLLDPKQPTLRFEAGEYDLLQEQEQQGEGGEAGEGEEAKEQGHRQAAAGAKIAPAAMPRLQALAQRGKDRKLVLNDPFPDDKPKVAAVKAERCEAAEHCGDAEGIPGTQLWRVLVEHGCGDACHFRWQMYDPRTKEFVDFKGRRRSPQPIDDGEPGDPNGALLARNGEGLIVEGSVYRLDGGRVFEGSGKGGGWLGGQWYVGP